MLDRIAALEATIRRLDAQIAPFQQDPFFVGDAPPFTYPGFEHQQLRFDVWTTDSVELYTSDGSSSMPTNSNGTSSNNP